MKVDGRAVDHVNEITWQIIWTVKVLETTTDE